MNQNWLSRLSIVVSLTVCFLLFQNFSLDNDYRDIRLSAPEGVPQEPRSGYFPEQIRSTSLKSLGGELLKHNFDDDVKHLEKQLQHWASWETGAKAPTKDGPETIGDNEGGGRAPSSYRFRTGLLGKDRVGLSLERNFKFKCEFSAITQEMRLSLDKSLSQNANLSLKHKTDDQVSSVNFSYAW